MGIFNGEPNGFSYSAKIIGRIPIEFNQNLSEHIKKDYELYVIEDENGDLRLAMEWNKTKIEGIIKDTATAPDMEEAQEEVRE